MKKPRVWQDLGAKVYRGKYTRGSTTMYARGSIMNAQGEPLTTQQRPYRDSMNTAPNVWVK